MTTTTGGIHSPGWCCADEMCIVNCKYLFSYFHSDDVVITPKKFFSFEDFLLFQVFIEVEFYLLPTVCAGS